MFEGASAHELGNVGMNASPLHALSCAPETPPSPDATMTDTPLAPSCMYKLQIVLLMVYLSTQNTRQITERDYLARGREMVFSSSAYDVDNVVGGLSMVSR